MKLLSLPRASSLYFLSNSKTSGPLARRKIERSHATLPKVFDHQFSGVQLMLPRSTQAGRTEHAVLRLRSRVFHPRCEYHTHVQPYVFGRRIQHRDLITAGILVFDRNITLQKPDTIVFFLVTRLRLRAPILLLPIRLAQRKHVIVQAVRVLNPEFVEPIGESRRNETETGHGCEIDLVQLVLPVRLRRVHGDVDFVATAKGACAKISRTLAAEQSAAEAVQPATAAPVAAPPPTRQFAPARGRRRADAGIASRSGMRGRSAHSGARRTAAAVDPLGAVPAHPAATVSLVAMFHS
ncbi:hypothetical protein BDW02DRAFT_581774 [Decorospora gaudefroyi]|uniref:Uncharacterized protein n=1 Tax=Decorospora gaudefroyi TaxID=184978 RepID=A0A6A5K425_9PLEO|nr:hypothetical protein BDW02DRAFT_581774 [Decorospora gaudefroyi]